MMQVHGPGARWRPSSCASAGAPPAPASRLARSQQQQRRAAPAAAGPCAVPAGGRAAPAALLRAAAGSDASTSSTPAAAAAPKQTPAPAAAAAAAAPAAAPKEWHAVAASADFFFNDPQNESLAEQLRERVRFFKEVGREVDFYVVPEPKWLDARFPEQAKLIRRPCVALVSSDKTWITFMKLRLDRVLKFELGAVPSEQALAVGGKVPEFEALPKWTAPYPSYTPGWWDRFIPGN